LEDSCRSDGEGVFEGGLLVFGEDDREEREDLALVVFTFFDQLVAEFGDLPEGLDNFFSDLALDVFTGSQELGNDKGVPVCRQAGISSVLAFLARASLNLLVW
jgi:hypothetical protein